MSDELRALVESFVGSLGEREREVFGLRYREALSHTEIEKRTGLSASKIKTAELRIRKSLLRHLHQNGYFEHVLAKDLLKRPRLEGEPS